MPDLHLERRFLARGCRLVAGLDEAGRGAWAGPVTAAAVILPLEHPHLQTLLQGVDDSKKLTPARREKLFEHISAVALAVGLGHASPAEIDSQGIVPATRLAMTRALAALALRPEALLIDAVDLTALVSLPQQSPYHGETLSLSIAAASIIAKVSRDRLMCTLDDLYPGYNFARHKGYGTAVHRAALRQLGITPIHRRSFAPICRIDAV